MFKRSLILVPTFLFLFLVSASSAFAARLYFNPSTKELAQECREIVDLYIDTQGANSNASDIEISFDPNLIEIIDSDADVAGTQIKGGEAYGYYFGNIVEQNAGRIRIASAAFANAFNGDKRYASIELKSKPGATSASLTIKYTGAGQSLDSNIAESVSSNDLLTSVTNLTMQFVDKECVVDTTPPVIQFATPTDGALDVAPDSPITFTLTDAGSGVDISTLQIIIDNTVLTSNSPGVSISGSPGSYTITITDHPAFLTTGSSIRVTVADLAGNLATSQININKPKVDDVVAPVIEFVSPTAIDSNWNINTPITLNLYDLLAGIDLNSLEIYINDKLFTVNSPGVSVTGTPNAYVILISNYLSSGNLESIRVVVKDLAGNRRESKLFAGGGFCPVTSDVDTSNSICIGGRFPISSRSVLSDLIMKELGGGGILALGLLLLSLLAASQGRLIWDALVALIDLSSLLFTRDLKQASGVVHDRKSFAGIPLAVVRVFDHSQKLVAVTRSNLLGRYHLNLEPGNYLLEIKAHHYVKSTVELKLAAGETLSLNLPLEHVTDVTDKQIILRLYATIFLRLQQARPVFMFLTLLSSLAAVLEKPRPATFCLLVVVLATVLVNHLIRRKSRGNSQMAESMSQFNLPGVSYVLYKANQLLDTGITGSSGRFSIKLPAGIYGIQISHREFTLVQSSSRTKVPATSLDLPVIEIDKNGKGILLMLNKKV